MAPSPVGIEISKGKRKWKIGKILGSGACATVCSMKVLDNGRGEDTNFAVKLAPLPKKTTRKGNSPEEINAKLLYYEQLVYTTQFRSLQGKFIPRVPNSSSSKDPPVYGEENGYRFFVMERMDNTISSAVPLLMKNKSSYKTINIGPLAVKMLRCVQAVHGTKNVVRDVKTENFMFTLDAEATGSNLELKLASRIRLIDLALATQWTSMYNETDDGNGLIGTPLYASLNLHAGKKTSFRDDLESLGYILAEIATQLYAGDSAKQLPWSRGKSDDDIGIMKRSLVDDKKSKFYTQLGNAKTIAVFWEYINIIRGYAFKEVPDYDKLSVILSKLTVPKMNPLIASSACTTSSSISSAATKRTRNKLSISNLNEATPSKVARRATRSTTKINMGGVDVCTSRKHDESCDETVYADAHQDLEEMDWEYSIDENEQPKEESKSPRKTRSRRDPALRRQRTTRSGKATNYTVINNSEEKDDAMKPASGRLTRRGVSILCIEGPYEGESYEIEAGVNEIMIIGSKPSSKVGEVLTLSKDNTLKPTHVRLDLSINRKLTAVKVTDKSKGETYINRHAVKSSKAFINDTIQIGNSIFKIKPL